MNSKETLVGKLVQIINESAHVESGWRQVTPGDADFLTAFVAEIDETIFPRRLAMRNDRGEILYLDVANRRLCRFAPPVPERLQGYECLFEERLADTKTQLLARVGAMLKLQFSGSTSIWLKSSNSLVGEGSAETGVSAAELTKALSISPKAQRPADLAKTVEHFRDSLSTKCSAWVHLNAGRVEESSGPGFEAEQLERWSGIDWEDLLKSSATFRQSPATPGFCILSNSNAPAECIIIIARDKACSILRTENISKTELVTLWQSQYLKIPMNAE